MPPPEPRSSTISPGFKVASAVGLPHPSEAFTASSGMSVNCDASYSCEVIGSTSVPQGEIAPQQELPPLTTLRAACPYFSFTTSLRWVLIISPICSKQFFLNRRRYCAYNIPRIGSRGVLVVRQHLPSTKGMSLRAEL